MQLTRNTEGAEAPLFEEDSPLFARRSVPSGQARAGIAKRAERAIYPFAKQAFDLIASALACLALFAPMAVIALLIFLRDPGNPFYVHERVGRDGSVLRLVKFRTMRRGASDLPNALTPEQLAEYRREYKLSDDPRLIGYRQPGDGRRCFGAVLRKTSLDELPQLFFNILLRRDMSIVGPRPILREELEKYYTPRQQRLLLSRKPGLTGYWQAYARNNAQYADGRRQRMEMYYAENASLWLDVRIICKTIATLRAQDWVK